MREYEFRAKDRDTGEWIYGYYAKTVASVRITDCILVSTNHRVVKYEIDINTLGQFTGLRDEHDAKVYEGDNVLLDLNYKWDVKATVKWNEHNLSWMFDTPKGTYFIQDIAWNNKNIKVTGNVHEK